MSHLHISHIKLSSAAIATALMLAGCASMGGGYGYGSYGSNARPYPNSANVYVPRESQQVTHVRVGTVIAVHAVEIRTAHNRKLAGEGIGAVAGGLLGHQVGGGSGKTLATIAGVLGGAAAGNAITAHRYRQPGLQITVRLANHGGTIAVTQNADVPIRVGQKVEVIGGGYGNQPARVEPLGDNPASPAGE